MSVRSVQVSAAIRAGQQDQARAGLAECSGRRLSCQPIRPNPRSMVAQVPGSGSGLTGTVSLGSSLGKLTCVSVGRVTVSPGVSVSPGGTVVEEDSGGVVVPPGEGSPPGALTIPPSVGGGPAPIIATAGMASTGAWGGSRTLARSTAAGTRGSMV